MSAAKARGNSCELCHGGQVAVYCGADDAFLCSDCDLTVHSANFLVARHLRRPLCRLCRSPLAGVPLSGPRPSLPGPLSCRSCSPDKSDLSNTEAPSHRGREFSPLEGIFVYWCRRLGIANSNAVAMTALRWMRRLRPLWRSVNNDLLFRVSLAASFWLGMKARRAGATWQDLRKVECVSGVARKLILDVETKVLDAMSRMNRVSRRRRIKLIRRN